MQSERSGRFPVKFRGFSRLASKMMPAAVNKAAGSGQPVLGVAVVHEAQLTSQPLCRRRLNQDRHEDGDERD